MINRRLLFLIIFLIPVAVVSFYLKKETNFILEENKKDNIIKVNIEKDNEVKTLDLEDYIIGVVAGEMPASFNIEALKAQAVASRSYALYKKRNDLLKADIRNQVYIDDKEMRDKWGNDYQKYLDKIKTAVNETKGLVGVYNGEIIDALYFAMSGGYTQDVKSVFGENLEYLKKTESKYDNEEIKKFKVLLKIDRQDFLTKLGLDCKNITVNNVIRNESGYVDNLKICDKSYKGTQFRKLLGLRSNNFTININEYIEITTYGYGHGVGMSQYGANGYANEGYDFKDILKHYYKDIEIKHIDDV